MSSNLDIYKKQLHDLCSLGLDLVKDLAGLVQNNESKGKKLGTLFFSRYQEWYSQSRAVVTQLLPERLEEFERLYRKDDKRKQMKSDNYTIQDWLLGNRSGEDHLGKKYFNDAGVTFMSFQQQVEILSSAATRFNSSLYNIKQLVQADLFDSEIDCAKELLKKGFARAAGAVAGVVLEKHLSQVCENHQAKMSKKDPGISDLNDLLKKSEIIELHNWRFIQRLADLRNLCDHNKEQEPKDSEIQELLDGVDKIMKTIF
jgi:uncharacterized protein YukE